MAKDYDSAKRALLGLLGSWERPGTSAPQAGSVAADAPATFIQWLQPLQDEGWTRGEVERLVWDVLTNHDANFAPATMDELGEVETALTGYCHPDSIIRFPGDPEDSNVLSAYVLGNTWHDG